MKKIILLLAICYLSGAFKLAAQKTGDTAEFKSAIDYNNYIIAEQEKVVTGMNRLSLAIDKDLCNDMDKALDSLKILTEKSLKVIKGMGAYNNNFEFRDAAVNLFSFYCKISKKEFKTMVNILKKGDKITKKDEKKIGDINIKITNKENILDTFFSDAQQKFAKENNFTIRD